MSSKRILLPLESLRGVAALIVAMLHFQVARSFLTDNFLVRNGDLMVDLFFVLSGYVISYNYLGNVKSTSDLVKFQKKRFWRLYPLHLLTLVAFLLIELAKYYVSIGNAGNTLQPAFGKSTLAAFLSNLVLLQAFTGHVGSYNGPSWSISVEFYAYIFFGLFSMLRLKKWATIISSILIAIFSGLTLMTINPESPLDGPHYALFLRCVFSFFIGVFFFSARDIIPFKNRSLVAFAFLIVSVTMIYKFGKSQFEIAIPLFLGLTICYLSSLNSTSWLYRLLSFKPTVWLGKVSYSIYMIHGIVWAIIGTFVKVVIGNPGEVINGVKYFTFSYFSSILIHILSIALLLLVSYFTWRNIEVRFNLGKK